MARDRTVADNTSQLVDLAEASLCEKALAGSTDLEWYQQELDKAECNHAAAMRVLAAGRASMVAA